MRLVISVLGSGGAARQLTRDLVQAGCQAERLFFLTSKTLNLGGPLSESPGLTFAGEHRQANVWCVREPEYFSTRIRDACGSLALCICLLDELHRSAQQFDWWRFKDNLDQELPVGIVHMPAPGTDELTMAKCVLLHSVNRLQVLDLVK